MNPKVLFGKPAIKNMRYPVEMILDLLGAGMTMEEILKDYPDLEQEDIYACLIKATKPDTIPPITPTPPTAPAHNPTESAPAPAADD